MISYLSGEVVSKDLESIVLDVHGVGYGVRVSLYDYDNLALNSSVKLFIYEHIREDSYDLYGASRQETLQLFKQLISVKNVGPKVAMAILALGSEKVVREAIAGGDVKKLQTAKGVGKRAAEQIVVELRDKVGLVSSDEAEGVVSRSGLDTSDDALQALVALGYNEYDAQKALSKTDSNLSIEDRIKQALKAGF